MIYQTVSESDFLNECNKSGNKHYDSPVKYNAVLYRKTTIYRLKKPKQHKSNLWYFLGLTKVRTNKYYSDKD